MFLTRIRVAGHSMEPTLKNNQIVIASSIPFIFKKPKIRDVVVLKRKKYIIKRIAKMKNNTFYVVGDNLKGSTDSRSFGWVDRKEIVGKVMFKI